MAAPMPDSSRLADDIATGNTSNSQVPLATMLGEPTHPALANVTCEQHDSRVTLQGEVPTFYLKQLAQETAARIRGIRTVENLVKVVHAPIAGRAQ